MKLVGLLCYVACLVFIFDRKWCMKSAVRSTKHGKVFVLLEILFTNLCKSAKVKPLEHEVLC